jgi:shikimate kinase
MQILLTGVSCVGKSTVGKIVGELLGIQFFDLDKEVEAFYETSIERLQNQSFNMYEFRDKAAKVLIQLLNRPEAKDCVIALPPRGLMGGYLSAIKKYATGFTIVITDTPENLTGRVRYYDIDSRPIERQLSVEDKKFIVREFKKDMTYFRKSYEKANAQIDISGLDQFQAAHKIVEFVKSALG